MKKFSFLFMILAAFALVLAACNGGNNSNEAENAGSETESTETKELAYKPEPINPETDVCEVCGMAIADEEHATQIIFKNEKSLKYDDIGDMFVWLEENGEEEIGAKFVRDFNTLEWIQLEEATFVYAEEISTPMGFGVISFKDRKDAKKYIKENEIGEILIADDLKDHKWEMVNHDHDHSNHGHDDHAHGVQSEGFNMHFTELENVTTTEETKLEVKITLDEVALEDAKVRYEIWKDNDKDNTDWQDAKEATAGSYIAEYVFKESGTYHIQVHVENDEGLHEHMEYEVNVKE